MKKTNIIATFGPAITGKFWDFNTLQNPNNALEKEKVYQTIGDVLRFGVNCIRFNFSHGTSVEQMLRLQMIRDVQIEEIKGNKYNAFQYTSTLLDTKGPEIRVGQIEGGEVVYNTGDSLTIFCQENKIGGLKGFSVTDSTKTYDMSRDCVVGNYVLVDDGKLSLRIVEVKDGLVEVIAENTHILKGNKRINLPGAEYSLPFLSQKDKNDIEIAVKNSFDFLALSFVNSTQNIADVREFISTVEPNSQIKVISKIETVQSLKDIQSIIKMSDGIMIARGDLGLEAPFEEVPYWTELIIQLCSDNKIPVIVATQMLDSLEKNIIPTRAEASDVYRATQMGSDSTMLSGETAQGMFPTNAVKTMAKINMSSESRKHCVIKDGKNFFSTQYKDWSDKMTNSQHPSILLLGWNDKNIELARAISNLKSSLSVVLFWKHTLAHKTGDKLVKEFSDLSKQMSNNADINIMWGINVIVYDHPSANLKEVFLSLHPECEIGFNILTA